MGFTNKKHEIIFSLKFKFLIKKAVNSCLILRETFVFIRGKKNLAFSAT